LVNLKGVSSQIPEKFDLAQNYPNPFNPLTKISFDLPNATKVTLTIYSLLGQKVKTLVDRNLEAGRHEITWNGKNEEENEAGSGIYFYYLKAGDFAQIKRMVLLK